MAQPSGDAVTIDKQTPTDKSEDLVASPVKRGRGRPPKGDGPRVPKTPSSGIKRPRGRPPKVTENGVSSNETQTNDDTPLAKKPRGRPVGSSKKSPKDSPTKGAGKGRGRPPGSTNNPFRIRLSPKKTPKKTDDASGEGTSKGRGRPKIPDELKRTKKVKVNKKGSVGRPRLTEEQREAKYGKKVPGRGRGRPKKSDNSAATTDAAKDSSGSDA